MAKLSQAQIKAHDRAQALIDSDRVLTDMDVCDILEGWHEGAAHSNARTSAFFTPLELAMSFAMELPSGGRILDLCAGIGTLSAAAHLYHKLNPGTYEFTLVELNPDYCAIAHRLLPQATIICGSIFDPEVQAQLDGQQFDVAISNPPYGNKNAAAGRGPRYTGGSCEYAIIDIASDYADLGVFLIPQSSVPFRITGRNFLAQASDSEAAKYRRFEAETGIILSPNMGIDTSFAETQWRGTSIRTEIALADLKSAREARRTPSCSKAEQLQMSLAA